MRKILAGLGILSLVLGVAAPVLAVGETGTAGVSATVTPVLVSVSVLPISTDYGVMGVNEVKKAPTGNSNDEFVVTNTGNVAENFDIVGANATGGVTWTLASTVGSDQYVHAYSALKTLTATTILGTTDQQDTAWVPLTEPDYQTLKDNVAAGAPQDLVLEMLTPSSMSDTDQKTTTVTVRATAHS